MRVEFDIINNEYVGELCELLDPFISIPYNVAVGELQADVVLHPVRMRVVLALGSGELTTREIQAWMPDVAQATLYRAINRLLHAKRIEVADHRKRGGATERVYRLVPTHRAGAPAVRRDVVTLTAEAAAQLATDMAAVVDRAIAASAAGGTPFTVSYSVIPQAVDSPGEH